MVRRHHHLLLYLHRTYPAIAPQSMNPRYGVYRYYLFHNCFCRACSCRQNVAPQVSPL